MIFDRGAQACSPYCPLGFAVASLTHFLVKLALAAPANFFSTAAASQDRAAASLSHFFMKLFSAEPRSFFSVALAAQSGAAGAVCAEAAAEPAMAAANSQIYAKACATSPALCSKEEFSQLEPPQENGQALSDGDTAGMLLLPAAGVGGGLGAWINSRSHPTNSTILQQPLLPASP